MNGWNMVCILFQLIAMLVKAFVCVARGTKVSASFRGCDWLLVQEPELW